jgi:predicted enzyme related to lactoylglutathione lyase
MLRKVAFTMYPVKDMNRALLFYKDRLGLIASKISANGAWVEYDLPGGGCFALTTLATGVEPSSTSGGCIAFEVDNLDLLIEKLKSKNVSLKLDIFHSPVCKMAIILDSEGNAVTLHQLNKPKS